MALSLRVLRRLLIGSGSLLIVLGVAFLLLTRTDTGERFVLERGLSMLRSRIQGSAEVARIRSDGLLRGVTLAGVSIRDPDGRPFLEIDSLRARYSALGVLRGRLIFTDVELWGPRVVLERLPSQGALNVVRIFAAGTGGPSPAEVMAGGTAPVVASGRGRDQAGVDLRGLRIHEGELRVRLPVDDTLSSPQDAMVRAPGGGWLAEYALLGLNADLSSARIGVPGDVAEEIEVRELAVEVRAPKRPIILRDLRGTLTRRGSRVSFDADRIWLPDSEFAGTGWVDWGGEGGVAVEVDLQGDAVHLRDFRWIDPRFPDAGGAFDLRLSGTLGELQVELGDLDLILEESRVRGRLGLRTGAGLTLIDSRLLPQPLDLRHLDAFLSEPLPVQGRLRGELFLDGPLSELRTRGELSLEQPAIGRGATRGTIDGTLHLDEGVGFSDLVLDLDPFQLGVAADLDPRARVTGPGSLRLQASGRMGGEVRFDARLSHRPADLPHSTVRARGTLGGEGDGLRLNVRGELEPLSFTAISRYYPDVPLVGEVSGTFEARGPVRDLDVRTRLATPGGVLALESRLNALDPGLGYRLEGQVDQFELSQLVVDLPAPTLITGRALIEGRGLSLDSLAGSASLELGSSRVGHLRVDTASTRFRVEEGVLRVDTLFAGTSVADFGASGEMAVAKAVPDGEIVVRVTSDSLGGLRPFFLGDTVIAGDTLSDIERSVLELQGVNPDTLPDEEAVTMNGRLRGDVRLRGSVRDFSARGSARVEEVSYGSTFLRGVDFDFEGRGLPGLGREVSVSLVSDSISVVGRSFQGVEATLTYQRPGGSLDLLIRRSDAEDYRTRASFEVDSLGGVVNLDQLTLRFEPIRWNLGGPAIVSWNDQGITVREFRLIRPGEDRLRILADGTLPFQGEADFRLAVDSLHLGRVGALAQLTDTLAGTLSLRMNVTGSARSPRMDGTFSVRGLDYRGVRFSLVQGGLRYRERVGNVGLLAWQGPAVALTADGDVPMDLAFVGVEGGRLVDEEMNLRIRTDALPAAGMLEFLSALEDVTGALTGQLTIAGTPNDPSPSGTLRLVNGGTRIPALGVTYSGVEGSFDLSPDGSVAVNLRARSSGRATVQGTITLDPATDPGLDLEILASGFQAVRRRDVEARLGGEVTLKGSYRRPLLEGEVRIDQGTLFLEEFARGARVVDLTDPAFFDVVDTSLVAVRPILAESRNPFLSNLRVDVDLVVERDSWIRSPDINAELSGELTVAYDRTSKELALVGTLQAVRGSYNAFGRRFEVQQGTVEFVGTPGLNPSLDLQAATRLRRPNQEPLNILANVEGTLVNPRVSLTSDAQPAISESDLVSYLIFGRPTNLLSQGERSVAGGAGQLLGGIAGAASSIGMGTLTSQLSSAVASEIGFFDYFAITTGQDPQGVSGGGNVLTGSFAQSLTSAQVEVGRYFFEDVFVAVLLKPLTGFTTTGSRDFIPGARLEWRFADLWTVEGLVEDRFARNATSGFGDLGFQTEQIFGVSLFREWGY